MELFRLNHSKFFRGELNNFLWIRVNGVLQLTFEDMYLPPYARFCVVIVQKSFGDGLIGESGCFFYKPLLF